MSLRIREFWVDRSRDKKEKGPQMDANTQKRKKEAMPSVVFGGAFWGKQVGLGSRRSTG